MISDVLYEAIEDIKRYRADFTCYPSQWPEMDELLRLMDAMRWELDTLPLTPVPRPSLIGRLLRAFSTITGFSMKSHDKHC